MNNVDRWIALTREIDDLQNQMLQKSTERDAIMRDMLTTLPRRPYTAIASELNMSPQRIGQLARRLTKRDGGV